LRPLKWDAFAERLQEQFADAGRLTVVTSRSEQLAGGHIDATVRVRIGQGQFRTQLLATYGTVCALTGAAPASVLEACHLYSYSRVAKHHTHGGLLLRRDIHRLFDLGFLAVSPEKLRIDVSDSVRSFAPYGVLHGKKLSVEVTLSHRRWLKAHWAEHRASTV
jgi:predicted restriction endonuclease